MTVEKTLVSILEGQPKCPVPGPGAQVHPVGMESQPGGLGLDQPLSQSLTVHSLSNLRALLPVTNEETEAKSQLSGKEARSQI